MKLDTFIAAVLAHLHFSISHGGHMSGFSVWDGNTACEGVAVHYVRKELHGSKFTITKIEGIDFSPVGHICLSTSPNTLLQKD